MALKIEVFSDFICPFCYIGIEVIRRLRPEFDFELEWRGFQIHPDWPAEGMPAARFYGGSDGQAGRSSLWTRVQALADRYGVEMGPPSVVTNSRLALIAAEFAQETGRLEVFEKRVFRAYFGEGENIGQPAVLSRLAAESGIDPAQMEDAFKSPRYDLRLKNNALVANRRGVSGVPTFFFGEFPVVGAQSPDVMRRVLERATERMSAGATDS